MTFWTIARKITITNLLFESVSDISLLYVLGSFSKIPWQAIILLPLTGTARASMKHAKWPPETVRSKVAADRSWRKETESGPRRTRGGSESDPGPVSALTDSFHLCFFNFLSSSFLFTSAKATFGIMKLCSSSNMEICLRGRIVWSRSCLRACFIQKFQK